MNKTKLVASGNSNMIRPRFGAGMLLQHEDLEQIVEYTTGMYRLLFRSLLGPGVVCGLEVNYDKDKKPNSLTIMSGVAMDCEGYVIEVPKDQVVTFDECNKLPAGGLIVLRRSKPKPCATRHAVCSEGMDSAISSREAEGFEILIIEVAADKQEEVIKKYLDPFNGNECSSDCCSGDGVMLASFTVDSEVLKLDEGRRKLRISTEKRGTNGADSVGQSDEQSGGGTDGQTGGT